MALRLYPRLDAAEIVHDRLPTLAVWNQFQKPAVAHAPGRVSLGPVPRVGRMSVVLLTGTRYTVNPAALRFNRSGLRFGDTPCRRAMVEPPSTNAPVFS